MVTKFINAEKALAIISRHGLSKGSSLGHHSGIADEIADEVEMLPAANVVEATFCHECQMHGHCTIENLFNSTSVPDERRFCGIGTP